MFVFNFMAEERSYRLVTGSDVSASTLEFLAPERFIIQDFVKQQLDLNEADVSAF